MEGSSLFAVGYAVAVVRIASNAHLEPCVDWNEKILQKKNRGRFWVVKRLGSVPLIDPNGLEVEGFENKAFNQTWMYSEG